MSLNFKILIESYKKITNHAQLIKRKYSMHKQQNIFKYGLT